MKKGLLLLIAAFGLRVGLASAQDSATPSIAVLDVRGVLENWTDYTDMMRDVQYVIKLDRDDLAKMETQAVELDKEADRNFASGELSEEDYRVQKAAVAARRRKLRHYWEIRQEIIGIRLEEDKQNRLGMMQSAVNDLGSLRGYGIIFKARSMAHYDEGFEIAPEITRVLAEMSKERRSLPFEGATEPRPADEAVSATEP